MDGKGKAPPAVGRIWLVGLSFLGLSTIASAGASSRNPNDFNDSTAVASS
jgi:hypothetical protein